MLPSGHNSNNCKNKSVTIWKKDGKRTYHPPAWRDNKIPDPAKQKQSKSIKKITEKKLEDAANEEQYLGGEDNPTSGEDSESEVVNINLEKPPQEKNQTDKRENLL